MKLFHLQQGCSKEEERLGCMGSFAKAGIEDVALGNGLLAKVTTVRLTKVTFVRRAKIKYLGHYELIVCFT